MRAKEYLHVWYGKQLVGKLWENSYGIIGFHYEKNWLNNGFAISQQMPLNIKEYLPETGKANQFFANLLPEANARLHIIRDLKISNSNFELLKAIGGECAGALSILPLEHEPTENAQYRKLNAEEFTKIILRKGLIQNLTSSKNRPRLSLAGAQEKCPIYYDGKNYALPEDASPSTHILKFEVAEYRNIPVYEHFMMMFAKSAELPVAESQLKINDKHYYLLIKRYDRIIKKDQQIQRLHQEDFCQALGVSYEKKYQQEGGPSFQDCYRLIQQVSISPIKDVENLLRWQIFNVLAGNSDAHAKNLSLLYNENHQPQLAPFYDLVCTCAIERIDTKLAMSVGIEFNPDKILLTDWEKMALDCNVRPQYLKKMIREMCELLQANMTKLEEEFTSEFGPYPALQCVREVINKQCKKTLKLLHL